MLNVSNILTLIEKSGEDDVRKILSTFKSDNDEVENFVHNNAIEFAKRKLSITYLVSDKKTDKLLGIFTLAAKAVQIDISSDLPQSVIRKIKEFDIEGGRDEEKDEITSTAFLLAQFSKNSKYYDKIDGLDLLLEALNKLREIQTEVGGKLLWLECEHDNVRALNLYHEENFGFYDFAMRDSKKEKKKYIRMVKIL